MNEESIGHVRQRRMRVAIGLLLLLALTEFWVRGPVRAVRYRSFNDFISPYMQTQAWLRGRDPYDPRVVAQLWPSEAVAPDFLVSDSLTGTLTARRGIPSPYPLTTFPLLAPLALLRWPVALLLWTTLNTAAFLTIVICMIVFGRISARTTEGVLVIISAFALAPFQTAIAASNIMLIVFALGMLAVVSLEGRRDICAGLLLAAAAALKPTVALCFLIYSVAKGRWRAIATAVLAGAAVFLVADVRMLTGEVHWTSSYLLNTQRMFASGAIDDYTPANRTRFDLLNLQLVIFQLFGRKVIAEALSWLAVLGLLGWWTCSYRKQRAANDCLFNLATLATLSLLPFYHRFTDGGLLFPAVAWSISESNGSQRSLARTILILAAPFLLPGAALLQLFAASNCSAASLARSWWWQLFVAPHQVWMLVAIAVLLLAAQRRGVRSGAELGAVAGPASRSGV